MDSSGYAYVVGFTTSSNFPTASPYQGSHGGGTYDVFITKLGHTSPRVTTGSAASVTTSAATLSGEVNGDTAPTTALFQYGVSSGVYTGTSSTTSISGIGTTTVSVTISSLSVSTTYYYRIAANNSAGTSTGSQASFTTSSSGGGGEPPPKVTLTVTSTSPSSGATGVGTSTAIIATFSMYMNGSTLTPNTFKLRSDSGDVTGSVTTNGATATFTPATSLAYNTTYTATITTGAQAANYAGTTLDSDYSWSFTTESAPAVPTPTPTVTTSPSPTPAAASSPTPALSPTPAAVSAELHLSKEKAYLSGDTVVVTVADADRDTNAASEDTLTTALKVKELNYYASGDLTLDLKENAVNSGTFPATIRRGTTTSGAANTSGRSNIGTIKTVQGGTATVVYTDTTPYASSLTKTLSFSSFDATLAFDAESYTVGSYAVITHANAEENGDATKVDTLQDNHAFIETSSFNRARIRYIETGVDTGTFKGSIRVSSSATLDYERIQASEGETLTVWCEDRINTTDAPRVVRDRRPVVGVGTPTPTVTPVITPTLAATLTPIVTPVATPIAQPQPTPTPEVSPSPAVCTAERIALSPTRLQLKRNKSGEVTVTVTGTNECSVEGEQVTAKINDWWLVEMLPLYETVL